MNPIRFFNITAEDTISHAYNHRCPHCANSGLVLPDSQRSVAWPCPMCALGANRATEIATGNVVPTDSGAAPIRPWTISGRPGSSFYHGVDVRGLSWEGGLTSEHRYYCSQPVCEVLVTRLGSSCRDCTASVTAGAA